MLQAGLAVAAAVCEHHKQPLQMSPVVTEGKVQFLLHAHNAQSVQVLGSWDGWREPLSAVEHESGMWSATLTWFERQDIVYKFLVDGHQWLDDPLNPRKFHDSFGGFNSYIPAEKLKI